MSKNTAAATRTVVNTKGALKVHRANCKKIRGTEALADTTATAAACCKPTAEMVVAAVDAGIAQAVAALPEVTEAERKPRAKGKGRYTLEESLAVLRASEEDLYAVAEEIGRSRKSVRELRDAALQDAEPEQTNAWTMGLAVKAGRADEAREAVLALRERMLATA